jgi:hypothetical protein
MSEHDGLATRGRALEEEYFRRKDRELIEKIRQSAATAQTRGDLGRITGLDDPQLVQELQELGFTAETVALLPLVPVIEVAWADGGVTKAEREPIVALARSRGIASGSAADLQLTQWLTDQPAEAVFAGARRLIRAMLDSGSAQTGDLKADDLVKYCEEIASASGGLLGIGRISASERALLSRIAADLHARRS